MTARGGPGIAAWPFASQIWAGEENDAVGMRIRCLGFSAGVVVAGVMVAVVGAGTAHAFLIRVHRHVYGILPAPNSRIALHARAAAGQSVIYKGGPVMVHSHLFLIFWGPKGSFVPTYETPIIQWAQGLAADSGRTTNEFSIASLFFALHPRRSISRAVSVGGAVNDTRSYPRNSCENPARRNGVCLSDGELQAEIARVIRAEHWPTDGPFTPKDQYLLFTPRGVDSCQDQTETSCTFSSKIEFCAYHSSFLMRSKAVVYANLPYEPGCASGQAPSGVQGNINTDGTLDSAIHEVLEAATDPNSTRAYHPAWTTSQGYEVGDECDSPPQPNATLAVYGAPLGGTLDDGDAFNQLIGGREYYTQQIWALATPSRPAQGCAQRVGPTPRFTKPSASVSTGQQVSFNGTGSYDLVGKITRYAWNYGDGSPLDTTHGAHGVHTYAAPGEYQVSLTVSDASGARNASTQTQTLEVK